MNTLTVLLQQIGMFVIYIITGVILIRTKVLTRENLEIISKVVIKLSLPVMIGSHFFPHCPSSELRQ